jgi:GH15 family glucan-1,4-alpha-glucosidase
LFKTDKSSRYPFSEDLDFNTKRLLGNFPQAYSHLALIDVAITLNQKEA